MTDDTLNITIHGPSCIHWTEPTKTSDYVVLALIEIPTEDGYTAWVCPKCEQVVLELWNYGEIDFGEVEFGVEVSDEAQDFFNWFSNVAEEPPSEQ